MIPKVGYSPAAPSMHPAVSGALPPPFGVTPAPARGARHEGRRTVPLPPDPSPACAEGSDPPRDGGANRGSSGDIRSPPRRSPSRVSPSDPGPQPAYRASAADDARWHGPGAAAEECGPWGSSRLSCHHRTEAPYALDLAQSAPTTAMQGMPTRSTAPCTADSGFSRSSRREGPLASPLAAISAGSTGARLDEQTATWHRM